MLERKQSTKRKPCSNICVKQQKNIIPGLNQYNGHFLTNQLLNHKGEWRSINRKLSGKKRKNLRNGLVKLISPKFDLIGRTLVLNNMVYDCRHKGSMFAIGPCEECKKKGPTERRTVRVVCTEKENKKLDCRVRWADDNAGDSPRDGDSDSERKKSPRSILKQRANCVIVIHDSDWATVHHSPWSAMSSVHPHRLALMKFTTSQFRAPAKQTNDWSR